MRRQHQWGWCHDSSDFHGEMRSSASKSDEPLTAAILVVVVVDRRCWELRIES